MHKAGAGTLVPSKAYNGVGVSTPLTSNINGTEVPAPEGYKQTKVGVIPEDWDTYRIDNVLQRIRKKVEVEKEVLYQQIGIRSHAKGIFHKEIVSGEALGNKSVFWIEKDCFIVNIVFAWEQAVAKTTEAEKGMIASHRFPMYKAKDNKVDIDYILYFFKSKRGKHLLGLASPGGAGRNKTLGQKEFSELKLSLPPLKEQQKIAQILTTWDDAISKQEDLIEAKEQLKKGLMQKLLSGEVRFGAGTLVPSKNKGAGVSTPSNRHENGTEVPAPEEMEKGAGVSTPSTGVETLVSPDDDNGTEVPAPEWKRIEFELIFDRIPSKKYQIASNQYLDNGKYPVIDQGKKQIVGYSNNVEKVLKNTGIIIFGDHTRIVKYIDFDFIVGADGTQLIKTKQGFDNKFFYYQLSIKQIPNTGYNRHFKFIKDMLFKVPSLEEQQKIAQVLTIADKEIALLKEEHEALREQKRGLMQRLLSGEVRVKV